MRAGHGLSAVLVLGALVTFLGGCVATRPLPAGNSSVALIQWPVPIDPRVPDSKTRLQYLNAVADALKRAGVPYRTLTRDEVLGGRLSECDLAILPYAHQMDAPAEQAFVAFLRAGGKLIACYQLPPALAGALGVRIEGREFDTGAHPFDHCGLVASDLQGAPPSFAQHSWVVCRAVPAGHLARTVYEWRDPADRPSGIPAVILSTTGAYVAHVLTKADREGKAALLVALIGHFLPDIWPRAADRAVNDIGRVGQAGTIAALRALVAEAQEQGRAKDADKALDESERIVRAATREVDRKRYAAAIALAMHGQRLAADAYVRTIPTRDSELRGVWLASPTGVGGWDWDRTVRHLSRMGFNALFANMAWGGEVAYNSDLLPLSPAAKGQDQLALCLRACKRYGVECHVWKVNLSLTRCTPEMMSRFLREGRVQKDREGRVVPWLCPTHPLNQALERDVMLEIVRKYDVDGLQLDFIRYPRPDCCYCQRCREVFERECRTKFAKWPADMLKSPFYPRFRTWRQDNITRIVKTTAAAIRRVKPTVELSAAVVPDLTTTARELGQDWITWVREDYLDLLCPMDYSTDLGYLRSQIAYQVELVGGEIPVYVGLASWLLQDVTDLADQISLARQLGADGYILFHYDDQTLAQEWMPQFRSGPTAINAVTPHSAPASDLRLGRGILSAHTTPTALADRPFTVGAWVAAGSGVERARLELHTLGGELFDWGPRLHPGRRRYASFSPPPGRYRPAIVGWAGNRPFVRKGRLVRVIAPE